MQGFHTTHGRPAAGLSTRRLGATAIVAGVTGIMFSRYDSLDFQWFAGCRLHTQAVSRLLLMPCHASHFARGNATTETNDSLTRVVVPL